MNPEARARAGGFNGDGLAVGDALGGSGEPQAAVAFHTAGVGSGEVPAWAFALAGGGVPGAAVTRVLSAGTGVSAGAGLGAAVSIVEVPLAVGVSAASGGVRAVGDRARASADLASGVPEAESRWAGSSSSVSRAGGSALSDGTSGVPDALGIFVTSGGGDVSELARSDASVVDPLADGDVSTRRGRGHGTGDKAIGLGGVGFATLLAHDGGGTSPDASGVGDACFLGGVLASAGGLAGPGGRVVFAASAVAALSLSQLLAWFDTSLNAV